jgi:cytochrome c6
MLILAIHFKEVRSMKKSLMRAFYFSLVSAALLLLCAAPSHAQSAGETLFKGKCAACHGPDGKGEVSMGKKLMVRDLSSADVQKQTDAQLTEIISKGKNKMPAYGEKLSKEQIGQLVAHIRELAKKK